VIREGLELMAMGMGGVFVFLLLLVGLMQASGRLWIVLGRWFPEAAARPAGGLRSGGSAADRDEDEDENESIAIALAVAAAAAGRGRARA